MWEIGGKNVVKELCTSVNKVEEVPCDTKGKIVSIVLNKERLPMIYP